MPGGGGDSQKEMLAKVQRTRKSNVPYLDILIKTATDSREGKDRNEWACKILTEMDFKPVVSNFLVATILANMAKEYGTAREQIVHDTVRAISERE